MAHGTRSVDEGTLHWLLSCVSYQEEGEHLKTFRKETYACSQDLRFSDHVVFSGIR